LLLGGIVIQPSTERLEQGSRTSGRAMNNIVYIVGLIVVVIAVLSFLGLH
jgi:hypothetical protein